MLTALVLGAPAVSRAQGIAGPDVGDHFKDTAPLKLPAGDRAAIMEFEDLECPSCAHAAPIVKQALETYKIPFLRHDFVLKQIHVWSGDAAVIARYLQDKVSPEAGEQYRRDVFANQTSIASKDDLQAYTRHWFQQHGQQMPFVIDPSGRFALEVEQDNNLAARVGITRTPTIFVLAPRGWVQVTDVTQLYTAIEQALAQTKPAVAVHNNVKKPTSAQH